MKKDILVKTGRKILPKSRFRSYLGKKFQKRVIDENNNRVWGTDTNTPLQSLEAMKFTLTLLEKCVTTLEGDVIECGVYKGGTSLQIAKKLKSLNSKKYLYALDTFEGHPYDDFHDMPEKLKKEAFGDEEPIKFKGSLNNVDIKQIRKLFLKNNLDNTIFLKGLFEKTFLEISDKKFCFAHVDADSYVSVKQCIEFLKDRMCSKGIILFDDYNYHDYKGCNKAVDELLGKSNLCIIKEKNISNVDEHGNIARAYWIKP